MIWEKEEYLRLWGSEELIVVELELAAIKVERIDENEKKATAYSTHVD